MGRSYLAISWCFKAPKILEFWNFVRKISHFFKKIKCSKQPKKQNKLNFYFSLSGVPNVRGGWVGSDGLVGCWGRCEEFLGIASNRISVDLVSGKQLLLVWVQVKAEWRGRTPRKSILIETAKPSKAKASETSYCESAFSGQHCDLPPFKTTRTHALKKGEGIL